MPKRAGSFASSFNASQHAERLPGSSAKNVSMSKSFIFSNSRSAAVDDEAAPNGGVPPLGASNRARAPAGKKPKTPLTAGGSRGGGSLLSQVLGGAKTWRTGH